MVLYSIIVYVVVFLLSEALRPDPEVEDQRPATLGDFQFPTATEDRPQTLVWGTVKLSGPNVLWYGDLKKKALRDTAGNGGIFSAGASYIIGYIYSIGIQMGLCRGGDDPCSLVRVYNNEEVVYEAGEVPHSDSGSTILIEAKKLYGGVVQGQGGLNGNLTFFGGTETQSASSYLSGFQDASGVTPAYRGMCYVVWEQGKVGTSTSIKAWEFEIRRIPTGLGVTDSTVNAGQDASIPHVIYEFITNKEWGLGQPPADIDVDNFRAAAATLKSEGNGFSFQLDSFRQASDLLQEIERQMAGKVFIDQETGKWTIALARADYVLGDTPIIDDSNLISEESFSRGAWEDTTNDIKVKYAQRSNQYQVTFAQAQDTANQLIQRSVLAGTPSYPGCKDDSLANNLAWREIRTLSRPLAKASLVVNRTFWNTKMLDVARWTSPNHGLELLPMRVTRIDLGQLADNKITLGLVEDIFAFAQPSYGDPFGTGWTPPGDTLVAIPSIESVIIDAPRAFLIRDLSASVPTDGSPLDAKVWCGFHPQGDESSADIRESNDATTPNSSFDAAGQVLFTLEVGVLQSDLPITSGSPSSFTISPSSSSQAEILDEILDDITQGDVGANLKNLLYVDGEFIGITGRSASSGDVVLTGAIRGMLDSVPKAHPLGTRVFILSGALTSPTFPADWVVDIKLLPENFNETLSEGAATTVQVDLDNRNLRPYPPSKISMNSSVHPVSSISLDVQQGSTEDTKGVEVEWVRRDYRTLNEVDATLNEGSLSSDFPAANSTEYKIEVYNDPDGANTLVLTYSYGSYQNTVDVYRTALIKAIGSVPSRVRVEVTARHTLDSTVYESRTALRHDLDVLSAQLSGLTNAGVLDTNDVGSFTAAETGTYTFTIATSLLSSGVLEAQINGGGYSTVIATSGTTGTLAGVTAADTIDFRHTQTGGGTTETLLLVEAPSSADEVYAVLDI